MTFFKILEVLEDWRVHVEDVPQSLPRLGDLPFEVPAQVGLPLNIVHQVGRADVVLVRHTHRTIRSQYIHNKIHEIKFKTKVLN